MGKGDLSFQSLKIHDECGGVATLGERRQRASEFRGRSCTVWLDMDWLEAFVLTILVTWRLWRRRAASGATERRGHGLEGNRQHCRPGGRVGGDGHDVQPDQRTPGPRARPHGPQQAETNARFDAVLEAIMSFDRRVSRIEGRLDAQSAGAAE